MNNIAKKSVIKCQHLTSGLASVGVWLVRHFAGFWKFGSRPSFANTPPDRQAAETLGASGRQQCGNRKVVKMIETSNMT